VLRQFFCVLPLVNLSLIYFIPSEYRPMFAFYFLLRRRGLLSLPETCVPRVLTPFGFPDFLFLLALPALFLTSLWCGFGSSVVSPDLEYSMPEADEKPNAFAG